MIAIGIITYAVCAVCVCAAALNEFRIFIIIRFCFPPPMMTILTCAPSFFSAIARLRSSPRQPW